MLISASKLRRIIREEILREIKQAMAKSRQLPQSIKSISDKKLSCELILKNTTYTKLDTPGYDASEKDRNIALQKAHDEVVCPAIDDVNRYLSGSWWVRSRQYWADALKSVRLKEGELEAIIKKQYEDAIDRAHKDLKIHIAVSDKDPLSGNAVGKAFYGSEMEFAGLWHSRKNTVRVDMTHGIDHARSTLVHELSHAFYTYFKYRFDSELSTLMKVDGIDLSSHDVYHIKGGIPYKDINIRKDALNSRMNVHLLSLIDDKIVNDLGEYIKRAIEINLFGLGYGGPIIGKYFDAVDSTRESWFREKYTSKYELLRKQWKKDRMYVTNPTEIYARLWGIRVAKSISLSEFCKMDAGEIESTFRGNAWDIQQLRMFLKCDDINMLNRAESKIAAISIDSDSQTDTA